MTKIGIALGILLGIPVAYALFHLALIEIGQDVVVLHKWKGEGRMSRSRLWIVSDGEHEWLHHGVADSPWIRHLAVDPIVEIERKGKVYRYRASADPAADPKVHRLLREKYGFADVLVRFWYGTDSQKGFVTRTTCDAVPMRLDPVEPGS